MKIDWRKKLSDRKFWAAVIGFVAPTLLAFGVADKTVTRVTTMLTSGAAVVSFLIADKIKHPPAKGEKNDDKDE